jgi:hypothetical protein
MTFGRYQEALATNGVDLIQIGRFGMQHKNAADIRMAVDAMESLITHPDVGVFILVTGDSDYSPLAARLREHGKHVVGVGTEPNASARLVSVCRRYKFWDTPRGPTRSCPDHGSPAAGATAPTEPRALARARCVGRSPPAATQPACDTSDPRPVITDNHGLSSPATCFSRRSDPSLSNSNQTALRSTFAHRSPACRSRDHSR